MLPTRTIAICVQTHRILVLRRRLGQLEALDLALLVDTIPNRKAPCGQRMGRSIGPRYGLGKQRWVSF